MNNKNSLVYLFVIATMLVVVSYLMVSKKEAIERESVKGVFLKNLHNNINNVEAFALRKRGAQVKVVLENEKWIIPDRYNYPVESKKIRDVIISSSNYQILEEKTNNPKKFKYLGLEELEEFDEGSDATRLTFMNKAGTTVYADFIRGKLNKSRKSKVENTFYARYANDNQAYLVQSDFIAPMNFHELFSKNIYHIEADRIARVKFKHPWEQFETSRSSSDRDFKIVGNTKPLKDPVLAGHISTMLKGALIIGDVLPVDYKQFENNDEASFVTFETFDGLQFNIVIIHLAGEYWLKISAKASNDDVIIKEEAENINKLASPWTYRVVEKTGELLLTKSSEIIKENDE